MAETWTRYLALISAAALATARAPPHVYRLEGLLAGRRQDGDEIDHGIGALDGPAHAVGIAYVGLHRMDLPDPAHGLQVPGQIRSPASDPNAPAAACQRPYRMPAHEPRPAENGYESAQRQFARHSVSQILQVRRRRAPPYARAKL